LSLSPFPLTRAPLGVLLLRWFVVELGMDSPPCTAACSHVGVKISRALTPHWMVVTQLFQGKEAIIEAQGKSTSMSVGLSSTSPLVLGAAVGVVGVTALTMQSMSNSGAGQGGATSAAVEAKAPEPEAFSAEAAAARSAEAQLWVERFRTRTEVAKRAAEAEAWISSFRFTTAMREREQRVAERAAWIAAWRSMSSGSGAVAEEAAKSPLCKWFVGLVEGMVFLNGGGLNGQEDKKANPNDMRGVMRKLDV
jgi:hypothetical protein